jgi:hypothetical protein
MVILQQDGAADGGGADQAAGEPEGGGRAPGAPRGRTATRASQDQTTRIRVPASVPTFE